MIPYELTKLRYALQTISPIENRFATKKDIILLLFTSEDKD
jgi:hypothetical protein